MADYIPKDESSLIVWFNDHAAGVTTHGTAMGLSAGDKTQAVTDADTVAHAINGRSLYESKKQEFTAYKNSLLYDPINTPLPTTPTTPVVTDLLGGALPACIPRARQRAERIKAHPSYTTAIGEDCRIVAPESSSLVTQPSLKALAQTGYQVRLTFAMQGNDQIEIQCKRGSESTFTTIAFDTSSPYIDARVPLVDGQPETRQYRCRFIKNDQPVGEWSDTVTVTAAE